MKIVCDREKLLSAFQTAALFALVFIAIAVLHLDAVPFALGFSVFVVSIMMLGLKAGLGEQSEQGQKDAS